uniref:Purkinje cell protein 4 n=1 Tax=Oreochromis niloticus TaxID=8128 RepID=A0A669F566_ORENI
HNEQEILLSSHIPMSPLSPEEKKNNLPQDFDIDMDAPETAKAAVTIQSQFRKFQKKKQDVKS